MRMLARTLFTLSIIAGTFFASYAQEPVATPAPHGQTATAYLKYIDQAGGRTVDEMVAYALANNPEIAAMRAEVDAARGLLRQARLRPNPSLELRGEKQLNGPDNSFMVEGGLPLELGGRRGARIRVAEAEIEVRTAALAERERQVAAEVRMKFGEALAGALKLRFVEEIVFEAEHNHFLVASMVAEGRRPPLEESQETVELNRMRADREMREGAVEVAMLELRNLAGMVPEEPLRIRGDFEQLLDSLRPKETATQMALERRPDLAGARAVEQLASARIGQARAEGRIDADLMLGWQRMKTGFPVNGIDDRGMLMPIEMRSQVFTFGVKFMLPVRNRNQGEIAAATAELEAATRRREFGELTIRREVAAAYAKFERSARAMQIYKAGVREPAAANVNVIRQTYELGSKTLLDYIAEHHRFMEVENGYVDALLEAYEARVEIMKAVNAPELTNR